ncbi:MAG TPA: hypothetical protein VGF82_15245 [Terracidiphilus sp.]|jgi:hypothetical protein
MAKLPATNREYFGVLNQRLGGNLKKNRLTGATPHRLGNNILGKTEGTVQTKDTVTGQQTNLEACLRLVVRIAEQDLQNLCPIQVGDQPTHNAALSTRILESGEAPLDAAPNR